MNFIYKNRDCLDFIKELKQNFSYPIFDAVITDPPYNISRENNFNTIGRNGINLVFEIMDLTRKNELRKFHL
ncbi:hypothetical protein NPA07_00340 [Mycoplasmopsis caviae]|uniref:Uncharacterized protein n=1 Tax=Mycoplasmopsis caviae TaxID=55603 RepID=A0A3P8KWS1_9BACT|nr:hypothetical protein [Mycoplasmopsis caviae]UUD35314.1 hypothetical protein NPA07_00340 [Mycoplasmopsis caviae]VDR41907.1 Uncharacterised protein [Mycoplasmopsis caviae]